VSASIAATLTLSLSLLSPLPVPMSAVPDHGPVAGGTLVEVPVPHVGFRSVAAGSHGSLGIDTDGVLRGWGSVHFRTSGGLNGINYPAVVPTLPSAGVVAYDAGSSASAAIDSTGTLWAWGHPLDPAVGPGVVQDDPAPLDPGSAVRFTAVSVGLAHALAIDDAGRVWAWGSGSSGLLGTGAASAGSAVPVLSSALDDQLTALGRRATHVVAGLNLSLVVDDTGQLWSWGRNASGSLGLGVTGEVVTPSRVPGMAAVRSVAAGRDTVVAADVDGVLWAWGESDDAQLGLPAVADSPVPLRIGTLGDAGAVQVDASDDMTPHVVALDGDGRVWAWGHNGRGELGGGATSDDPQAAPVRIEGLSGVTQVTAGSDTSAAVRSDGTLFSWGADANGSLGRGVFEDSPVPVRSGNGQFVRAVFGGVPTAGWVRTTGAQTVAVQAPAHPSGRVTVRMSSTNSAGSGRWDAGPATAIADGFTYQAVATFDPRNGAASSTVLVTDGPVTLPPEPTRSGHTFAGWWSDPDEQAGPPPATGGWEQDRTFVARWEPVSGPTPSPTPTATPEPTSTPTPTSTGAATPDPPSTGTARLATTGAAAWPAVGLTVAAFALGIGALGLRRLTRGRR
jgi:uncharacterized repeat protein (TIGR02543 family)